LQQIVCSSYAVFRIFVWGTEKIGCLISLSLFDAYSTCHWPGLPFRTFNSSTFHRGNPTPCIPSSNSLGSDVIRKRETQAFLKHSQTRLLHATGTVRDDPDLFPLPVSVHAPAYNAPIARKDTLRYPNRS